MISEALPRMTYDEAIAFWHGRIDYERRQPKPGDLKLDRMRELLSRLGDPHQSLRCVHIAGTKGKGSTSALLASVLRAAGLRTGMFTSPHLCDVSERIQVNGIPISPDEIAAGMSRIAAVVSEMDARDDPAHSPTFFEIITALGFLHFRHAQVDLAVIEVGLGGRFDSTNVCEPLVSVITNVSYDHMAILGSSLSEIAYQKAGIIKPGAPVVSCAEDREVVRTIEREAFECDAPLSLVKRDFDWKRGSGEPFTSPPVWVMTAKQDWGWLPLSLYGIHQGANAAGVVATVEYLRQTGLAIADQAVAQGLGVAVWPGRMELLSRHPVVVLDCAHNVASTQALVQTLRTSFPVSGYRHLIFSASSDKQIDGMLDVLAPMFDRFYLTRYRSNPRSADPELIARLLRDRGTRHIDIHHGPAEAWVAARSLAGPDDGIVVAGSVFLAGELRPFLVRECAL